jgi:hypothetical protein
MKPEHPNRDRKFTVAEMRAQNSPAPKEKFFRFSPDIEVQRFAKELLKYIRMFGITREWIDSTLKPRFGESVGHETLWLFLDQKYGAAMRPRPWTMQKYKHLLSELKKREQQYKKELDS